MSRPRRAWRRTLEPLDARALEQAARYAGEHGSRALIVARHDHIVFERYWQGTDFDTLSDAQSFTPLLAALATGVAIAHRRIGWPDEPLGAAARGVERGCARGDHRAQSPADVERARAAGEPATCADLTAAVLSAAAGGPSGRHAASSSPPIRSCWRSRSSAPPSSATRSYLSSALWRRLGAADAWLWLDHPGGTAHADCCMFARQGDWIRVGAAAGAGRQLPRRAR